MEVEAVLEVWNDVDTEAESEVSDEECEDNLVVQECVGNSPEEEEITLDSAMACPSGASARTGCLRRNHVVYDWKEISNSKEGGTTACNACFTVIFVQCGCFNAKMEYMHISLCSIKW